MIYKITNIRLRSGRTLNRGFIIESDKMLSRNKIATLIKERTNFTPVDFSSKIHRSLLESDEDVKAAMAAGTAKQNANKETNAGIRNRNEELRKSYKKKHEEEVQADRDAEAKAFYSKRNNPNSRKKSIVRKGQQYQKLKKTKQTIDAINTNITELNNKINKIQPNLDNAEADMKEKEGIYQSAYQNYEAAKEAHDTLLNNKNNLTNKVKEEEAKREKTLGKYKNEDELNKKLSNLKTEINARTNSRNARLDKGVEKFEDELKKKYDYSDEVFDKKYKDDYENRKESEIDVNQGVNLAKVENYFNTKEASLDKIIEKLRNKPKYKRLNNMLDDFKELFGAIKETVITQYNTNKK